MSPGETVDIAALERHLDGDNSLRPQFDPRRGDVDLVGAGRRRHASDNHKRKQDSAGDATHRMPNALRQAGHEPAPTAFRSAVSRWTSNSAMVTTSPFGASRA